VGADAYGGSVFEPPRKLRCRREDVRRMVLDGNGREVVSSSRYFLTEAVAPGDTLDGLTVLSVAAVTSMFGRIEGYEASCA